MKLDDAVLEELERGDSVAAKDISDRLAERVYEALERLVKAGKVVKSGYPGKGQWKALQLAQARARHNQETPLMPRGPKGEKRPADVNARAVMIGKIATGEVEDAEPDDGKDPAAKALGKKGGAARAAKMTPERRAEIARNAAAKRWKG